MTKRFDELLDESEWNEWDEIDEMLDAEDV